MHSSIPPISSPESWLKEQYLSRLNRNKAYSLRAFANQLEMSTGQLSEIFSGKRRLTPNMVAKISEQLAIPPLIKQQLLEESTKGSRRNRRTNFKRTETDFSLLEDEIFSVIADWEHFAILSLMKLPAFDSDSRWIAKRLGLTTREVNAALKRLVQVRLIQRNEENRWIRIKNNYVTSYEIPSAALRESHRQSIEQALKALNETPLSLRDITSITFPADLEKMAIVKGLISRFQRRVAKLMETPNSTSVYNLNIQLVPVTKVGLPL